MSEFAPRRTRDRNARRLVDRLRTTGKRLPADLHEQILNADDATGRALVALIENELSGPDSPTGSWPAIHAIRLVGKRRQRDAVEPLLQIALRVDVDERVYTDAVFALQNIGEPALEPILQLIDRGVGREQLPRLAEVLCELDVRDDRIFEVLLDVFRDDPQLGASYLASYGDPAALDVLHEAFEATEIASHPLANHVFIELASAIDRLDGELTSFEQAKLNRVRRMRSQFARSLFGD